MHTTSGPQAQHNQTAKEKRAKPKNQPKTNSKTTQNNSKPQPHKKHNQQKHTAPPTASHAHIEKRISGQTSTLT
jgi:hypothetical protein